MREFIASLLSRVPALFDKSAILLIVPALAILYFIDSGMAITLLQWVVFAPVLAGVAVHISRIVFPQVNLTDLVESAGRGNTAAGIVTSSIILFVSIVFLALVVWAKA